MNKSPYDELVPDDGSSETQPQETAMIGKRLRNSKTFWINLITIFAGIAATVGGSEFIQDNPTYAGIAATVLGVVNIFMRFITKDPVTAI